MKITPLIFSAPMILALLAGTKTQTRRIMKPQPQYVDHHGRWYRSPKGGVSLNCHDSRYGEAGDLLWVRETCRAEELADLNDGVRYDADKTWRVIRSTPAAADAWIDLYHYRGKHGTTVPPIHMPRWVSRLTLKLTAVRVERLQDISEADAKAEGICYVGKTVNNTDMWAQFAAIENSSAGLCADVKYIGRTAVQAYERLWESINGADSWAENPWVWVLTFEVIKQNIDEYLQQLQREAA